MGNKMSEGAPLSFNVRDHEAPIREITESLFRDGWRNSHGASLQLDLEERFLAYLERTDSSNASLLKALEEAKAKFEKVADWLDKLSDQSKAQAKTSERFESLREACLADARNYAGTAKSIRSEIARIDAALQHKEAAK